MSVRIARVVALPLLSLLSLVLAAGCAAPVGEESTSSSSEAMLINPGPPPPVAPWENAMSLCSTTVADHSTGYPASPGYKVDGTSNAASSCDFYVTEVTGVASRDITLVVATSATSQTDLSFMTSNSTWCNASFAEFQTFGQLPGYWEFFNGYVEYVPGQWVKIDSGIASGHAADLPGPYGYDVLGCAITAWNNQAAAVPSEPYKSGYTRIRVATRAILYANDGSSTRGPVSTYVVPAP